MDYFPEKFEIDYTFFGYNGSDKLYLKDNALIFESKSDCSEKDSRKLEIFPSEDDWIRFWSTLDKIGVWMWKEKYRVLGFFRFRRVFVGLFLCCGLLL